MPTEKKYRTVSAIADKNNELIPMDTEFDISRVSPEAKKKFLSLKAIEVVHPEEVEEEETGALTLENLNKMGKKALVEIATTRNLEFDPKATPEELAKIIDASNSNNAG